MYNYYDGANDVLLLQASGNSDGVVSIRAGGASQYRDEQVVVSASETKVNNVLNAVSGVQYPNGGLQSINANRMYRPQNYLINGSFDYWQRGTAFAVTPDTNNRYYTADRWYVHASSPVTGLAVSRTALANGRYSFYMQRASSNANVNARRIIQEVDRDMVRRIRGRRVRLLATVGLGPNFSGTLTGRVYTGTGADENATVFTSTLTGSLPARTAYTSATIVATGSATGVSKVVLLDETTTAVIGTNVTTMAVVFEHVPAGTAGALDAFSLSNVMLLDAGSDVNAALPVGEGSYYYCSGTAGAELYECQRYYEKTYNQDVYGGTVTNIGADYSIALNGNITNGSKWPIGCHPRFKVTKRAVPNFVTVYGTAQITAGLWTFQTSDFVSAATDLSQSGFAVMNNTGSTAAIPLGYASGHWLADAEI
jgi:hypothetical protein